MLKPRDIIEKTSQNTSSLKGSPKGRKGRSKLSSSPLIKMLKAEVKLAERHLETETRMKRLLLDELMNAQTLVEKEFLIEMISITNNTRASLEEKKSRFQQVINRVVSKIENYECLLLPEELEYFNKIIANRKRSGMTN